MESESKKYYNRKKENGKRSSNLSPQFPLSLCSTNPTNSIISSSQNSPINQHMILNQTLFQFTKNALDNGSNIPSLSSNNPSSLQSKKGSKISTINIDPILKQSAKMRHNRQIESKFWKTSKTERSSPAPPGGMIDRNLVQPPQIFEFNVAEYIYEYPPFIKHKENGRETDTKANKSGNKYHGREKERNEKRESKANNENNEFRPIRLKIKNKPTNTKLSKSHSQTKSKCLLISQEQANELFIIKRECDKYENTLTHDLSGRSKSKPVFQNVLAPTQNTINAIQSTQEEGRFGAESVLNNQIQLRSKLGIDTYYAIPKYSGAQAPPILSSRIDWYSSRKKKTKVKIIQKLLTTQNTPSKNILPQIIKKVPPKLNSKRKDKSSQRISVLSHYEEEFRKTCVTQLRKKKGFKQESSQNSITLNISHKKSFIKNSRTENNSIERDFEEADSIIKPEKELTVHRMIEAPINFRQEYLEKIKLKNRREEFEPKHIRNEKCQSIDYLENRRKIRFLKEERKKKRDERWELAPWTNTTEDENDKIFDIDKF